MTRNRSPDASGRSLVTGRPPGEIVLEDHLFFLCTQVIGHRDRLLDLRLRRLGLSASTWRIVGTLAAEGALPMRDLSERTTIERTTLSRAVGQLVRKGLVRRLTNSEDGRIVEVALTPAGRRRFEAANALVEPINAAIARQLTAADADGMRTALQTMKAELLKLRSAAPPGEEAA